MSLGSTAACDPDAAARAAAGAAGEVPLFADLGQALAWGPDAVLVCTPTHLHAQTAVAALTAGAHVFVEKPIALDPADGDAIGRAAAAAGRIVLVGCNMRFHPAVRQLKAWLDDGTLGTPWTISAHFAHYLPNWRAPRDYRRFYSARAAEGGGIITEAIHEIDYVEWLGGGIEAVRAAGGHVSDLETDAEDVAVLYCRLANGAAGIITLDSLRHEKSRGCEITGSRGVARWLSVGKNPERVSVAWLPAGPGAWRTALEAPEYDANREYEEELAHFVRCVRGEDRPLVDAAGGTQALRVALSARQQIRDAVSASEPRR